MAASAASRKPIAGSEHDGCTDGEVRMKWNCGRCGCNAPFSVVKGKVETLGGSSFDLECLRNSGKSIRKIGTVKPMMTVMIDVSFFERLSFFDQWVESQGNEHAEGIKVTVRGTSVELVVRPAHVYGVGIGARLALRSENDIEGRVGTVVRYFGFRVVLRMDATNEEEVASKGMPRGATQSNLRVNPEDVQPATRYQYDAGQKLLLLRNNRTTDAAVVAWSGVQRGNEHQLSLACGQTSSALDSSAAVSVDLNELNHSALRPSFANVGAYEATRTAYCLAMCEEFGTVEDGVTGNVLQTGEQLIYVATQSISASRPDKVAAPWRAITNVTDMAKLLLAPSPKREHGTHASLPCLVRAAPGTGKTWMVRQAAFALAQTLACPQPGIALVPLVLFVQRLVRLKQSAQLDLAKGCSRGLLPAYIEATYACSDSAQSADVTRRRDMLLQAYEMGALIVLLDGVDEAAGHRGLVEDFIFDELVPSRNRLVVTSRPEGVTLERYMERFVIINLLPLSEEQQRHIVRVQTSGSAIFNHLITATRVAHDADAAYAKAFTEKERFRIEALSFADGFRLPGSRQLDPAKRQHECSGSRVVDLNEGSVQSQFLGVLDRAFRCHLSEAPASAPACAPANGVAAGPRAAAVGSARNALSGLDAILTDRQMRSPEQMREAVDAILMGTSSRAGGLASALHSPRGEVPGTLTKLGLLLQRRNEKALKAASLWERVVRRTDELYVLSEKCFSTFQCVVNALSDKQPHVISLKDPVRVHEKATTEYGARFAKDEGLPEACVTDVLRATIFCTSGARLLQLVERLVRKPTVDFPQLEGAALTLLSLINAFDELTPLHQRSITCTFWLHLHSGSHESESDGGREDEGGAPEADERPPTTRMLVEIKLVHQQLTQLERESGALELASYFRSRTLDVHGGSATGRAADGKLRDGLTDLVNSVMGFLLEASSVPVLLSLLVLCFGTPETATEGRGLSALPTNRNELYTQAIARAIELRTAKSGLDSADLVELLPMLSKVATANHLAGRREFTSLDVAAALGKGSKQHMLWMALDARGALPLIKTLEALVAKPSTAKAAGAPATKRRGGKEARGAVSAKPASTELQSYDVHGMMNAIAKTEAPEAARPTTAEERTPEGAKEAAPKATDVALYQFTHLSFQEGLYVRALCAELSMQTSISASDVTLAAFLNNPFFQNPCRIAGGVLGTALASQRPVWDFSTSGSRLDKVGRTSLWLLAHQNAALKHLNVSGLGLGTEDCDGLTHCMRTASQLLSLNLSNNGLGRLSTGQLSRLFRQSRSLTALDVSFNSLGAEGVHGVSHVVSSAPLLSILRLNGSAMTDESCGALLARIGEAGLSLTTLEIASNRLTCASGGPLVELLRIHTTLTSIDVRGNDLGAEGGEKLLRAVQPGSAQVNTTLRFVDGLTLKELCSGSEVSLSLANMGLGVHDGVLIGGLSACNATSVLRHLHAPRNGLGEVGALRLLEGLPATVEAIDLSENRIGAGGGGGSALAHSLRRFSKLASLGLNGNGLGSRSAIAIAEALHDMPSLTACQMRSNDLNEAAGIAFAAACQGGVKLGGGGTLTSLDLNDNAELGEATARALLAVLHTNSSALSMISGIAIDQLRGSSNRELTGGVGKAATGKVKGGGTPRTATGTTPRARGKGAGTSSKASSHSPFVSRGSAESKTRAGSAAIAANPNPKGSHPAVDLTSLVSFGHLEGVLVGTLFKADGGRGPSSSCLVLPPHTTEEALRALLGLLSERFDSASPACVAFAPVDRTQAVGETGLHTEPVFLICSSRSLELTTYCGAASLGRYSWQRPPREGEDAAKRLWERHRLHMEAAVRCMQPSQKTAVAQPAAAAKRVPAKGGGGAARSTAVSEAAAACMHPTNETVPSMIRLDAASRFTFLQQSNKSLAELAAAEMETEKQTEKEKHTECMVEVANELRDRLLGAATALLKSRWDAIEHAETGLSSAREKVHTLVKIRRKQEEIQLELQSRLKVAVADHELASKEVRGLTQARDEAEAFLDRYERDPSDVKLPYPDASSLMDAKSRQQLVARNGGKSPIQVQLPDLSSGLQSLIVLLGAQKLEMDCAICLCRIKAPTILRGCAHMYCKSCIEKWIESQCTAKCPQCRKGTSFEELMTVRQISPSQVVEEQRSGMKTAEHKLTMWQTKLRTASSVLAKAQSELQTWQDDPVRLAAEAERLEEEAAHKAKLLKGEAERPPFLIVSFTDMLAEMDGLPKWKPFEASKGKLAMQRDRWDALYHAAGCSRTNHCMCESSH